MSQDLETLLQHRVDVLRQLSEIGDLRQGSLTASSANAANPAAIARRDRGMGRTFS